MLYRGQVDDQVAGSAEQADELLAQGGSRRDTQFPAERRDDVAAAVCPGGETEAGLISRGVCHSASGDVSRGQAGRPAARRYHGGRRRPGRDYAWRGARCSIFPSADIAVRNTPAVGRCARVRAVVTSDGIGGTAGFGRAAPLWVTSEGIGGTAGLGG